MVAASRDQGQRNTKGGGQGAFKQVLSCTRFAGGFSSRRRRLRRCRSPAGSACVESAAVEAGIGYIEVSQKLQRLIETLPELTWFVDDGQYPGKHLALLNAILVYEAVLSSYPVPGPLVVKAPIYGGNTGLEGVLRQADAAPPMNDTPGEVRYSSEMLVAILHALEGGG